MKLTDAQIKERIVSLLRDVTGSDAPTAEALLTMSSQPLDVIRYPNDEINQFVFESILIGSNMPDAFEGDADSAVRARVLVLYLEHFGMRLSLPPAEE